MVPQELKYTKEHEWVKFEKDEAVVGITDHAQSELGDITFVELPNKDSEVKKTEAISTIESVKAASEVYAPLSGKIIAVNEILNEKPEVINESPYTNGWICRIHVSDISEENVLLDAEAYEKYLKENES
ncbi:MAG: glycine cleavage system protein GcvH [Candidatus Omnitrophota bacterium]